MTDNPDSFISLRSADGDRIFKSRQTLGDGSWHTDMVTLCVMDAAVAEQADRGCVGNKNRNCLFTHPLRN